MCSFPSTAVRSGVLLRNVLLKALRDSTRALAWWSLGLAGLVALMVSV